MAVGSTRRNTLVGAAAGWAAGTSDALRMAQAQQAPAAQAVAAEGDIVQTFFQWKRDGMPAGNNWNRSKNNAQYGVDYFDRPSGEPRSRRRRRSKDGLGWSDPPCEWTML